MSNQTVSRRTLAKGAAWAVPGVVVSSAAPAIAASTDTVAAVVCGISYGAVFLAKSPYPAYQEHGLTLGTTSDPAGSALPLPQNTVIQWTITMNNGKFMAEPTQTSTLPAGVTYKQEFTPATSAQTSAIVTATLTITADGITTANLACPVNLAWGKDNLMSGDTEVDIVSTVKTPDGATVSSGLSYKAAKRYMASLNDPTQHAHVFSKRVGAQNLYPAVAYKSTSNSNSKYACGLEGHTNPSPPNTPATRINDTSTIYPNETCVSSPFDSTGVVVTVPANPGNTP